MRSNAVPTACVSTYEGDPLRGPPVIKRQYTCPVWLRVDLGPFWGQPPRNSFLPAWAQRGPSLLGASLGPAWGSTGGGAMRQSLHVGVVLRRAETCAPNGAVELRRSAVPRARQSAGIAKVGRRTGGFWNRHLEHASLWSLEHGTGWPWAMAQGHGRGPQSRVKTRLSLFPLLLFPLLA